jgi:hypothetical protein
MPRTTGRVATARTRFMRLMIASLVVVNPMSPPSSDASLSIVDSVSPLPLLIPPAASSPCNRCNSDVMASVSCAHIKPTQFACDQRLT